MTQPAQSLAADQALPVLPPLTSAEAARWPADPEAGFGCLRTGAGNLPLATLDVDARITGLVSRVVLTQRFVNPNPAPVEATYVFPLPGRAAVTGMRMITQGRTVVARLRERGQARAEYDAAIAEGRRASVAEEERPEIFTMRVGNILPGEAATVELSLAGVLPVADGEVTFRFPLVVAPRYIPGSPLPGEAVGAGHQPDTDAVPDASRISPPVLLPGFPHPVRLSITVALDPAGLPMSTPRSSLHAVLVEPGRVQFRPGERPDRDIVLRIPLGAGGQPAAVLTLVPDAGGADPATTGAPDPDGAEGTFEVVVLPPDLAVTPPPRDVVLLLDRSGSMAGWKIVAARRAAARIVDTLTDRDRFAVLAFDSVVETPGGGPASLWPATDRHRFRAVEFLAGVQARGGTELAEPLGMALALLGGGGAGDQADGRAPVLVLVTDGQVGNEDQILRASTGRLGAVRVHTVGIDQAVNAGFLGRLAGWGRGRCELVESEDRLDEAMARIHERIGSPVVAGVTLETSGVSLIEGASGSARLPDIFPGVPWVVRGRYRSAGEPRVTMQGVTPEGHPWSVTATGRSVAEPAITATWARARVRDLEDQYVAGASSWAGLAEPPDLTAIEQRIVGTSLRFGVLCRLTAFVAIDERVVTDGGVPRTVVQPVEYPAGWEPPRVPQPMGSHSATSFLAASAPRGVRLMHRAAPALAHPAAATAGPAGAMEAGPAGAANGAPRTGGDDALWALLVRELHRLRGLDAAPVRQRRAALADLGTWLPVVPRPAGLPEPGWDRLLSVLAAAQHAGEPFEDVWRRAIEQLAALVAESAEPLPAEAPAAGAGEAAEVSQPR
jgi:Ca-activated chloride channel family protein